MENSGTSGGVNDAKTATTITLNIKFSGRSIPVSVSPNSTSTVKDLKSLLQPLTNVLTRGQKLIFKGRVLADGMTLRESEITDGAKVMLMASQGLHQGGGPILKEAPTRPILRETAHANPKGNKRSEVFIDKGHLDRWKLTGVIALSECQLKV
ncbi:LRR repeats and ubiquitin-like domain-containing protein [Vitis vinifera]|uniref:LRR repeats and ubiquitin-like domain-containing protein n=1 Tax=Vitis vinifera TaxID=29760 RepID=A0A438F8T3_VITVI|nr:LRR repeats and ubiquitin-like domain-containing protein [Vitis vinifera]